MPNLIEFHCPGFEAAPVRPVPGPEQALPRPGPAVQQVPAWLKQMPADVPGGPDGKWLTIKKCPPLIDALTGGYLIPLVADVWFSMKPDGVEFRSELNIIQTHPQEQVQGSPIHGTTIVKFINPWIIKTPPGYSCLFTAPLNRFEIPFHILSGIVETDTYYREVNFPSICMMRPGTTLTLKKGTPIAQVFPIRREPWTCDWAATDMDRRHALEEEFKGTMGYYKEHYWERKEFD